MSEHFIKNIEIKNFKCFKDFKAEGFGRVNLIGGKNNVGKTAFMEACFLASIDKDSEEFINRSIIVELHRNSLDFLLLWLSDFTEFKLKYKNKQIFINLKSKDENWITDISELQKKSSFEECLTSFHKKGLPPLITNTSFISVNSSFNSHLVDLIDEIKLTDKEDSLNKALKSFFDINKIDIIKNKVMLKKESKYLLLSEFGDGVKHFLNIILALYLNKNSILYLDEIENGIHHSKLDKLWNIILTIAKEQNVQVFATTHSKECIKALVTANTEDVNTYQLKEQILDNDEIKFIELGRTDGKIDSVIFDFDELKNEVEQNMEIRGW